MKIGNKRKNRLTEFTIKEYGINGVLLAGHVTLSDRVFLSGNVVVHQFVRVGCHAMVGGGSRNRLLNQLAADATGIPVYFYEEAARIPERRHLEAVRKGQYEGLAKEISRPERSLIPSSAIFRDNLESGNTFAWTDSSPR